jgi:hypothetical protein
MILHLKFSLFLSDFKKTLVFSENFPKSIQISNFLIIRPVGAEFFHANGWMDRRTDRYNKASNRFSQILRTRLKNIRLENAGSNI